VTPKPMTAARLRRSAEFYLSRYAPSRAQLRATLGRRIRRAGEAPEAWAAEVDEIVAWAERTGLVDDAAWAESKARRMVNRGVAPTVVKARLRAHGVDPEPALAADPDPALTAARALCRRRRLGPWRPEDSRAEHRQDDLAKLGRAGFSYTVAKRVLDEVPEG
jgi:regulatory protein